MVKIDKKLKTGLIVGGTVSIVVGIILSIRGDNEEKYVRFPQDIELGLKTMVIGGAITVAIGIGAEKK